MKVPKKSIKELRSATKLEGRRALYNASNYKSSFQKYKNAGGKQNFFQIVGIQYRPRKKKT